MNFPDPSSPRSITDVAALQQLVVDLLNVVGELSKEVKELKADNQLLRDETNRLKGEHGLPKFKKKRQPVQPAKGTDSPTGTDKKGAVKSSSKKDNFEADRLVKLLVPPSTLPPDAVFKGYKYVRQQNLRLVRDNVLYQVETYYSAAEGRSYRAPMPDDYRGHFGHHLVSLTQLLSSFGDMTQQRLHLLYTSLGVDISKATINNILLDQGKWVLEERDAILKAGLKHGTFQQMDGTRTVQRGEVRNTQVICAEYFKVFYTRKGRTRLDIISVLQGMDGQKAKFCLNRIARHFMNKLLLSSHDKAVIERVVGQGEVLDSQQLWQRLEQDEKLASAKKARRSKINDALALGYYYTQQEYRRVNLLLSDGGKEYMMVARNQQALCWLHDLRDYRKMAPRLSSHRELLKKFISEYWSYYDRLKAYREADQITQQKMKIGLSLRFDQLFAVGSDYECLAKRMKYTLANKYRLLTFLDHPAIPLHNNSAERGMRRVIRKRDISLHTSSDRGTSIKDSFLSVVETARKLGVNILDYIDQRVRGQVIATSLASIIEQRYNQCSPAL